MIKRFMVNYGGVLKECTLVTDKDRSAQDRSAQGKKNVCKEYQSDADTEKKDREKPSLLHKNRA